MNMHKLRRLFASASLATFAIVCSSYCQAQEFRLSVSDFYGKIGYWTVGRNAEGGCLAARQYVDGTTFWIGYAPNDRPLMAMNNPKWNSIEAGRQYDISFHLNSRSGWSGPFTGYQRDFEKGLIVLTPKLDFLAAVSHARNMAIEFEGQTIARLSLDGIGDAYNLASQCQHIYTQNEAQIANAKAQADAAIAQAEKLKLEVEKAHAPVAVTAAVSVSNPDGSTSSSAAFQEPRRSRGSYLGLDQRSRRAEALGGISA
jgi:hypothetical protein